METKSLNLLLTPTLILAGCSLGYAEQKEPNVVYVLVDQLRAQALGYAGDENVMTPHIDQLASESIEFTNAISGLPVSTPHRATLMTGQYPLNHGLFQNDLQLNPDANTIGKSFKAAGYNTAYVGKWHINGHGREKYIAPEFRQGFDYFKALECTHNYNKSPYFDNNDTNIKVWEEYDTFAQTTDVIEYMREHSNDEKPFMMVLSIGTPHNPYGTAPKKYRDMYADATLTLRDNVTEKIKEQAISDLKGYYAHTTAIDDSIERLQEAIKELGIEENTIFIFTSDHGDMMGSQGMRYKQKPYEESIGVPFLLKYPAMFGEEGRKSDVLLNSYDIMPTLLSLCNIPIPDSVDGEDVSAIIKGEKKDKIEGTLIMCINPMADYNRRAGGREYRGVRTKHYTYVKDLNGPWLLFDNVADPYQMNNLVNKEESKATQKRLEKLLSKLLKEKNDEFLTGWDYIDLWGYRDLVDKNGTTIHKGL